MVIAIPGVRPSADIRAELAAGDAPILLAFSRGKDSIAAWLALREAGVEVIPYHMYAVPRMTFVEDSLRYFEAFFGVRIAQYPHASLYRLLNNLVFQPPERCAVIEAAELPEPDYDVLVRLIRGDFKLSPSAWVADGVRACDSIVRRLSMTKHGPMKWGSHKVSAVWDWQKADVMGAIAEAGVELPIDYEWFGRSWDGLDRRFSEPLSIHAPQDWAKVLDWYPLADMELFRHGL